MRFAWNFALVAGLGVAPALGQEWGNATGAQQSADFPTLYQGTSVEIVTFGYIRAGVGWRDGGAAPQRCLQLPEAPVKYRLGNECEIYIEPGIEFAFGDPDGTHVDLQFRTASVGTTPNAYDDWEHFVVEAWTGLDDFASEGPLAGARIWAGQRFFNRQDTHIHDFYYFDGTGMGVGIEEIPFGRGELSFTYFEDSTYDAETALSDGSPYRRVEARIEDWTIGEATLRGSLDLRVAKDAFDTAAEYGAVLSGEADIENVANGTLTLAGQIGWGSGSSLGYASDDAAPQDAVGARTILSYLTNRDESFAMQATGVLELQSHRREWLSLGARPIFRLGESDFHIALEPGLGLTSDDGETARLLRLTAALMWKPGGTDFFDRPSFRAYISRSDWNGAAETAGITPFYDGTAGTTFGLQAEHFF